MPSVLYGVSPIGLGHATRSLVVIRELEKRGASVRAFSGGKAADFLRENGVGVDETVEEAAPRIERVEMGGVASWYVRAWLAQRRNVERAKSLIGSFSPDVVVCDEEFSGAVAAGGLGVRRVFISDELQLGFARTWVAARIEGRVERWYQALLKSVDALVVPDEGEDSGNLKHVGPIVRTPTSTCAEVRAALGLPPGPFVLVSLSGSGVGRELAQASIAAIAETRGGGVPVVVTGNRGETIEGPAVRDLGVFRDNQNLVACADLVISTAGKSTIDEAAAAGTPVIVVPIRHHAEQERNAAALGYAPDDLQRLPALVKEKMGARSPPRSFGGGERAAGVILAVAGG